MGYARKGRPPGSRKGFPSPTEVREGRGRGRGPRRWPSRRPGPLMPETSGPGPRVYGEVAAVFQVLAHFGSSRSDSSSALAFRPAPLPDLPFAESFPAPEARFAKTPPPGSRSGTGTGTVAAAGPPGKARSAARTGSGAFRRDRKPRPPQAAPPAFRGRPGRQAANSARTATALSGSGYSAPCRRGWEAGARPWPGAPWPRRRGCRARNSPPGQGSLGGRPCAR